MTAKKMTIQIWSDIVCPSCYIGKRKLESALFQFEDREHVEIIWKTFQLDPDFITDPKKTLYPFLEESKGMSREQVMAAATQITAQAEKAGLTYNLEQAIPANSFLASQLSHLAKQHNLQNEAEEVLFKAYFTEGKNIDDLATLIQLGKEIGLDVAEVKTALATNKYAEETRQDILEATKWNITSIPTFVFDEKLKVSGVQESSVLSEILKKAVADWKNEPIMQNAIVTEGQACKIGEDCQ